MRWFEKLSITAGANNHHRRTKIACDIDRAHCIHGGPVETKPVMTMPRQVHESETNSFSMAAAGHLLQRALFRIFSSQRASARTSKARCICLWHAQPRRGKERISLQICYVISPVVGPETHGKRFAENPSRSVLLYATQGVIASMRKNSGSLLKPVSNFLKDDDVPRRCDRYAL